MKKVKLFYGNMTSFSVDSEVLDLAASKEDVDEVKEYLENEVEIKEENVARYLDLAFNLYRLEKGKYDGRNYAERKEEFEKEMTALLA